MAVPQLVKLEQAAIDLGVPKASLLSTARRLGLLVRMGRAVRIDRNSYEELVRRCQEKPREPASTVAQTLESGTSAIPALPTDQQARATVAMLKGRSRRTSPAEEPSQAPVTRIGSR